jgi:hypothetical protein
MTLSQNRTRAVKQLHRLLRRELIADDQAEATRLLDEHGTRLRNTPTKHPPAGLRHLKRHLSTRFWRVMIADERHRAGAREPSVLDIFVSYEIYSSHDI